MTAFKVIDGLAKYRLYWWVNVSKFVVHADVWQLILIVCDVSRELVGSKAVHYIRPAGTQLSKSFLGF